LEDATPSAEKNGGRNGRVKSQDRDMPLPIETNLCFAVRMVEQQPVNQSQSMLAAHKWKEGKPRQQKYRGENAGTTSEKIHSFVFAT